MKRHTQGNSTSAFNLIGRVCVVIGCGLIGSEFARRCVLHGGTVVVADINVKAGKALAQNIGATFIACDATRPASVRKLVARTARKFGRVDGVVSAVYPRTKRWGTRFDGLSYDDFVRHVSMLTGPQFLIAREFGALMKKQKSGSIVFMGSIYGTYPPRFEIYEKSTIKPPPAEYAMAKGGLWALTRYLAKYYGPCGVRVNMLSPGGVGDAQDKAFRRQFNKHALLGNRMALPEDISPALVYLFADASRYMTGQNIIIDGGWTL